MGVNAPGSIVSIVVPVYKVEAYLERCVDSILAQTYANVEVILVNDGSPDESPSICDMYASKDKRVRVIHKKNGGLSDARNAGMEIASGEWVSFVDSDDSISERYVEDMLEVALRVDADVVCCGYTEIFDTGATNEVVRTDSVIEYSGLEAAKDVFSAGSRCEVMAWNKLYKRSLFASNGITYPVGKIHEDNFTTYKVLFLSGKVVCIPRSLYNYTQRSDSIMGRTFSESRLDVLEVPGEAEVFFDSYGVSMERYIQSAAVLAVLGLYTDYCLSGEESAGIGRRLGLAKRGVGFVFLNNAISIKHRLLFMLLTLSTGLYGVARRAEASRRQM